MAETISKHLGEGFGKGELYAALAHDTSDSFGGMEIKSICMNWSTYDETTGDGRVCFANRNMYVAPYTATELDIVAPDAIWIMTDDIYLAGNVHFYGDHEEGSTSTFNVTLTDPTPTGVNAIYGYIDAGATWTSGNMVGVRGKVAISGTVPIVSATGVWAGLDFADAAGAGSGLTCALNAEVSSDNATEPNAIVYIQSLPAEGADFSDVPYIVFAEEAGGTGSNILFEVGHAAANKVPTLTSDTLFYQDTLRIAVNKVAGTRTKYYIPLSTVTGTFTTAYPIDVTVAAGTAIDIGTSVTGISFTGTYSAHGIAVGVSGSPIDLVAYDDRLVSIWGSSDATEGNVMPLYVSMATSGSCKARAAEFVLTPTATMGSYGNAIKGYLNLTGASGSTGTLSGICAEVLLPDEAQDGSLAVLELEMVSQASFTYASGDSVSNLAFILMAASGTAIGEYEDHGALININGLTDGTGNVWFDNTLKIGIDGTAWYLPMSTAQASFTTAYPIVTTYATNAIDISTCAIGINFSGTPTIGINMPGGGADYTPILIGEKTNLADGGFKVAGSGDDSGGIQVYADDSGDAAAGEVISPFRVRYLLSVGQTGGVTQTGLFAQMRTLGTTGAPLVLNTGSWRTSYVFSQLGGNTIQGGAEITGMNQATTLAGNMIVTSGSFTGIDINIAGSGTITNNSVCAALLIRSKETPVWTNGIQIADAGALTGINIGACTTAAITISGAQTLGLNITGTLAAANASAIKSIVTVATPLYTDGAGVHNFQLTTTGTVGGHTACASFWINTATGATGTGNSYLTPICTGIWEDAAASMASTKVVVGARIQGILGDTNYTSLNVFSLNIVQDITALWEVSQFNSNIGFTAGTNESSTPSGYVAFMSDVGQNVKYIRLYDDMS